MKLLALTVSTVVLLAASGPTTSAPRTLGPSPRGDVRAGVPERSSGALVLSNRGERDLGGAFNASYSGKYNVSGYCRGGEEVVTYNGSGTGSFIHASTDSGSLKIHGDFAGCKTGWEGTATLVSSRRPRNAITFSVSGRLFDYELPCGVVWKCTFTVTGGTGRFSRAAGSGTLKITYGASQTYSSTWSGQITF